EIIDAIGHRSAEFPDQEVMHPDLFRRALRSILAAIVAEVADQLLLLGVDRDHRLLFNQRRSHLGVDMGELRISVGVAVTLLGLAVALQAITGRIEQFGHQGAAHLVALLLKRLGQSSHALAGPPQWRFRIPPGRRFDQRLEIRNHVGSLTIASLRPAPGRRTRPAKLLAPANMTILFSHLPSPCGGPMAVAWRAGAFTN